MKKLLSTVLILSLLTPFPLLARNKAVFEYGSATKAMCLIFQQYVVADAPYTDDPFPKKLVSLGNKLAKSAKDPELKEALIASAKSLRRAHSAMRSGRATIRVLEKCVSDADDVIYLSE